MKTYDDLVALRNQEVLEKLTPVDSASLLELKKTYSGLPEDYVEFLENFGCGELGEEAYMLYSGLRVPSAIYGQDRSVNEKVLLLGDDFLGYCNGFSLDDWSVIEIDPTNLHAIKVANSFNDFIRKKIEWCGK